MLNLDQPFSEIFRKVLEKNASERLTAAEILTDPWVHQHAEDSLTQCYAALADWESAKHCPVESHPAHDH